MLETLKIKDFCGISEVNIQFSKYTLFIGPQSSGKSVIAKVAYWIRTIMSSVYFDVMNGRTYRDIVRSAKEKFVEMFAVELSRSFSVEYVLGEAKILASTSSRNTLTIDFSDEFKELISLYIKYYKGSVSLDEDFGSRNALQVRREGRKYFNKLFAKLSTDTTAYQTPVFVPAARSFFSQVEDSLFVFLASSRRLDPTIEGFGDYLSWIKERRSRKSKVEASSKFDEVLYSNVLKGKYRREDKKDFIVHPDGRSVPVASASSGQQEVLPLCLILSEMWGQASSPRSYTIEEPEAHLFPLAQRVVVEAIAAAGAKSESRLVITTHSPYVLSVLNNLLMLGSVLKKTPDEENPNLSNKYNLYFGDPVNPGDLSAYYIVDGTSNSMIDSETGLIDAKALDGVSQELSIIFDNLLDQEYSASINV